MFKKWSHTREYMRNSLNTELWPKWTETATKLENIMVSLHREKYAYEKFYSKMPDYTKYLNNFVEMGVVLIIVRAKSNI